MDVDALIDLYKAAQAREEALEKTALTERAAKTAAQQEWVVELRVSSDAGLEVRPRSQPGLCLTAPPLHTKEGV